MPMDFWKVYESEKAKEGLGTKRLYITSRDRIHLSLSSVERYGTLLGINQGINIKFSEAVRYVLSKEITHDLLLSLYDVNNTRASLLRLSEALPDSAIKKVAAEANKVRNPNLEMRVMGLQDADTELLDSVERFHKALKPSVIELDLFGGDMRHIVFDLKLGMSFDLLLLNRIYRPHELANTMSLEDFAKKKSEFKFV